MAEQLELGGPVGSVEVPGHELEADVQLGHLPYRSALHLAVRVAWQLRHDDNVLGNLVPGERFLGGGNQLRCHLIVVAHAADEHDVGAQRRVADWAPDRTDSHLTHCGVAQEELLHLDRVHIRPAHDLDVVDPAVHGQEAVLVHGRRVACGVPLVGESTRRLIALAHAERDCGSGDLEQARFARRHRGAILVHHAQPVWRQDFADAAVPPRPGGVGDQRVADLRGTEDIQEPAAERRAELGLLRLGYDLAAADGEPQGREASAVVRRLQHLRVEARLAVEDRDPVLRDDSQRHVSRRPHRPQNGCRAPAQRQEEGITKAEPEVHPRHGEADIVLRQPERGIGRLFENLGIGVGVEAQLRVTGRSRREQAEACHVGAAGEVRRLTGGAQLVRVDDERVEPGRQRGSADHRRGIGDLRCLAQLVDVQVGVDRDRDQPGPAAPPGTTRRSRCRPAGPAVPGRLASARPPAARRRHARPPRERRRTNTGGHPRHRRSGASSCCVRPARPVVRRDSRTSSADFPPEAGWRPQSGDAGGILSWCTASEENASAGVEAPFGAQRRLLIKFRRLRRTPHSFKFFGQSI